MTQLQIINNTIEKAGVDVQLSVCMEECAELIQAISKVKRYGCTGETRLNLIEEITDVKIIISELMLMYGITAEELQNCHGRKMRRMEKRLSE